MGLRLGLRLGLQLVLRLGFHFFILVRLLGVYVDNNGCIT